MNKYMLCGALALLSTQADAAILFDNIPVSAASLYNTTQSQLRGPGFESLDSATVHFFTLGAATQLTKLDAAISGFNGFDATKYANIQYYSVNVYSNLIAASSNLTGDIFHADIAPGLVALTNPYNLSITRLASIPFAATLAAGNYYIGVTMRLDRATNGQIGLRTSQTGQYDFFVNPNGGFGLPGNRELTEQLAYRLEGNAVLSAAPEPGQWALLLTGFGLLGAAARRRQVRYAAIG